MNVVIMGDMERGIGHGSVAAGVGEVESIAQSRTEPAIRVERVRIFWPIGKTLRLR
jgi:hypothetical protein